MAKGDPCECARWDGLRWELTLLDRKSYAKRLIPTVLGTSLMLQWSNLTRGKMAQFAQNRAVRNWHDFVRYQGDFSSSPAYPPNGGEGGGGGGTGAK